MPRLSEDLALVILGVIAGAAMMFAIMAPSAFAERQVLPSCPSYTARELRLDDGSLVCLSGDGDALIYDIRTKAWQTPMPFEQELLPND